MMARRSIVPTFLVILGLLFLGYVGMSYWQVRKVLEETRIKARQHQQQQESLTAQLQVVYEHRSRLEKILQNEKSDHKNTREEYEDKLEKHKKEASNRYNAINIQHKMLQTQHEDVKQELEELKQKHSDAVAQHEREKFEHEDNLTQLQRGKEDDIKNLRIQLASAQDEFARLQQQQEETMGSLRQREHELQLGKMEKTQMEQHLAKMKADIDQYQNEKEQLTYEHNNLMQKAKEYKQHIDQLSQMGRNKAGDQQQQNEQDIQQQQQQQQVIDPAQHKLYIKSQPELGQMDKQRQQELLRQQYAARRQQYQQQQQQQQNPNQQQFGNQQFPRQQQQQQQNPNAAWVNHQQQAQQAQQGQVNDRTFQDTDALRQLQQKREREQQYYKQQQELIQKYRLKRQQSQAKRLAKQQPNDEDDMKHVEVHHEEDGRRRQENEQHQQEALIEQQRVLREQKTRDEQEAERRKAAEQQQQQQQQGQGNQVYNSIGTGGKQEVKPHDAAGEEAIQQNEWVKNTHGMFNRQEEDRNQGKAFLQHQPHEEHAEEERQKMGIEAQQQIAIQPQQGHDEAGKQAEENKEHKGEIHPGDHPVQQHHQWDEERQEIEGKADNAGKKTSQDDHDRDESHVNRNAGEGVQLQAPGEHIGEVDNPDVDNDQVQLPQPQGLVPAHQEENVFIKNEIRSPDEQESEKDDDDDDDDDENDDQESIDGQKEKQLARGHEM